MGKPEDDFEREPSLLADRERLDRIAWVMHAAAQKVLSPYRKSSQSTAPGWALPGGTSIEDVVQEALSELAAKDLTTVSSLEGLGVNIAQKRAVDALRKAKLDKVSVSPPSWSEGFDTAPWGDRMKGEADPSAEEQYELLWEARRIWELSQTVLDDRERRLFYDVHFLGRPRAEVGRGLDPPLTGQRVGQIYAAAIRRLWLELSKDSQSHSIPVDGEQEGQEP